MSLDHSLFIILISTIELSYGKHDVMRKPKHELSLSIGLSPFYITEKNTLQQHLLDTAFDR